MKKIIYILCFMFVVGQESMGQTFAVAYDTVSGSAFQCITPPNKWRGNTSYGQFLNSISFPGAPRPIKWQVVASDFPSDWLGNFALQDSAGFYSNLLHNLWSGTPGDVHLTTYPAAGGQFNFYITEATMTSTGTHWLEVNLKDTTSTYSQNIWFVVTREPASIGDTLTGASEVCPGAVIKLLSPVSNTGTWRASNANASVTDSFVTGVTSGLDTIAYTGPVIIISGSDTCTFSPTISKTVTVYPAPAPTVTVSGNVLYAPAGYVSYQWLFASSPITGATGTSYEMLTNGMYAVTVSDNNGCYGTSAPYYEEYLAVPAPHPLPAIKVFPNPASSVLNIETAARVTAKLTTVDGRMLMEQNNAGHLDISKLPGGIYLLTVYDSESGAKVHTEQITKVGE